MKNKWGIKSKSRVFNEIFDSKKEAEDFMASKKMDNNEYQIVCFQPLFILDNLPNSDDVLDILSVSRNALLEDASLYDDYYWNAKMCDTWDRMVNDFKKEFIDHGSHYIWELVKETDL